MRGCVFDQHAVRAFWPFEVRPSAGVTAGAKALLGQRNHRAWNISWQYFGCDGRWIPGGALSRTASDVGRDSSGMHAVGLATSFAISRVPAADPTKRFRWNPLGDL